MVSGTCNNTWCIYILQEQKTKGVIAASAGNHALALAYHGHDLDIPVTVVMPIIAPMMKVQACKSYGAHVIVKGENISEVCIAPECTSHCILTLQFSPFDFINICNSQNVLLFDVIAYVSIPVSHNCHWILNSFKRETHLSNFVKKY